ncbi:MAG: 1-deoxy-D-xylulose-5-phosphate reductoisomerase [Candidatus Omnitrophica bacterium]|nr:1-deoxy-D-xylulose-5-phosphate reductoisomerase [Candidatus Omnitrophota bacterium]MCM8793307.1 1-deoxy-D-xylulose-5-phosphate reductoisomerase [Candidatus Omnitrophota bacterium]
MKRIAILGSTGSVGVNVLKVVSALKDKFKVVGLTTYRNLSCLRKQIAEFHPEIVVVQDSASAERFKVKEKIDFFTGMDGLVKLVANGRVDLVVICIAGANSLLPLVESIKRKKEIALASKESMVMAGELLVNLCQEKKVRIIPIDSEHSAIFQCLHGRETDAVRRIILTSSGGPFRLTQRKKLEKIEPSEALKHPCWKMGKKITIDSATLMNKGLEIIEARWLFNFPVEKIEVLIHPEAIVHSLVEFIDGNILALLGITDMRLPIQYALTYPQRFPTKLKYLDLAKVRKLTFEKPDFKKFSALNLAYEVAYKGRSFPCVLNASDEVCVEAFLQNKIRLTQIPLIISRVIKKHKPVNFENVEEVLAVDKWAREETYKIIGELR